MIKIDELTTRIIRLALDEDCTDSDITTNSLLPFDRDVIAEVTAKESGIISGTGVFKKTFEMVDPSLSVDILKKDGEKVTATNLVIKIKGKESSILKAERTALNFLQRLSGIASLTSRFVANMNKFEVEILDTRKTTPGMRYLQKKAVKDGGGTNHRMNLADMAMIKDNHINMAGSITLAVDEVLKNHPNKKVEVEVKRLNQLREALKTKAHIIMLDNFKREEVIEAVKLKTTGVKYEISGNVSLENIHQKIVKGIDYISVGFLTHSFKSMDLSLNIKE